MATPRAATHRDLEQRFRNLEAALRRVTTAALRRPQFAVEDGDLTISGGDLIVDGGDFLLLDTDGSTVFRLGPQTHGDRGVSLYREDGTVALAVRKPLSPADDQKIRIFDAAGNPIVEEQQFGSGLGRPYLSLPMQPVGGTATPNTYGPERVITSGTFVDVFRWEGTRQNTYYRPVLNVRMTDTTTAGEVRIVDGAGTVLVGFFQPAWTGVIPVGTTANQTVEPPYTLEATEAYGDQQVFRVQARRTAGAGSMGVSVRVSEGA